MCLPPDQADNCERFHAQLECSSLPNCQWSTAGRSCHKKGEKFKCHSIVQQDTCGKAEGCAWDSKTHKCRHYRRKDEL